MKGWVLKAEALAHCHSVPVRNWLNQHNTWVPCEITKQRQQLKEGYVFIRFEEVVGRSRFALQVPIEAVNFEHKPLVRSLPLKYLSEFKMLAGAPSGR